MLISTSCRDSWDKHYSLADESVKMSMWDAIAEKPEYSEFVNYMKEYGLDSIFAAGGSYTLFIPDNEAFEDFNTDTGDMYITTSYHILDYVLNVVNVENSKPLRTITGKYAPLEESNSAYKFSGNLITASSPLYMDGRYYEIEGVAFPLSNLWEYICQNTTVLMDYIEKFDSVFLDKDKSIPLRFDDDGNIIYDSVFIEVNYFDTIYFPLNREDRNRTASFILFTDEQFGQAMDNMAINLGSGSMTAADIPDVWKDEVLFPELIESGLFPNSLDFEDFAVGRLKNILGDSVDVDYANLDPDKRILASNGVIFNYLDFQIPESLYQGEKRLEGEHMVDLVGTGIYNWKPEILVEGDPEAISLNPIITTSDGAENDSLVGLTYIEQPFTGEYSVEMVFENLFPQKYLFVMGANYRPSGVYEIYANDSLIRTFDTFRLRQSVVKADKTGYYRPDNGNNRFDAYIENMTEFGNMRIKIKYAGPGGTSTITPLNGLSIDFISIIPTE